MDVGIEDVYLSTAAQVELKGNPDSDKNVKYVLEDIENEIEDGHYADDRYTSEDQGGEENTPESISVGNDGRGNENIEPFLGMEFETQCAARSYYNDYAKRAGFGTRISYSHRSKRDRKMIGQQYVCVKEGFPMSKEGPSKIPRSSARIGCKASMTVKRENCGKWVVRGFEKDHNHDLASPEEVQFLRSHRGISSAAVNLISNIPGLATHLSNIINNSGGNSEVKSQVSSGVQKQWKRNLILAAQQAPATSLAPYSSISTFNRRFPLPSSHGSCLTFLSDCLSPQQLLLVMNIFFSFHCLGSPVPIVLLLGWLADRPKVLSLRQ